MFLSIAIFSIIVLVWLGFRIIAPNTPTIFAGTSPTNIGIQSGHLTTCFVSPNCVSSQAQDEQHFIQPLTFQGDNQKAIAFLATIINNQPRTKIIKQTDDYLYVEFTSKWMGFVDDVEFYVNPQENIIEVKSASRLGESDLGINRNRIETIRKQLIIDN
jgi:uncharacterized protein (DUF1499 family)